MPEDLTLASSKQNPSQPGGAALLFLLLGFYILSEPWMPALLMSTSPALFEALYPVLLVVYAPFDLLLQHSESFKDFYQWYVFRLAETFPGLFA